jgi:hypothetical protein
MAPGLEISIEDDGEVEHVPLMLPLDRATLRWLCEISGGSDIIAAAKIAGMIRDIRRDDEAAHINRNLH